MRSRCKTLGESVWKEATSSISNLPLLFKGLGEDSWLVSDSVKMPFAWLQEATTGASDATTSASQAGDAAQTFAEPILSSMPGWFEWIMQIMLPTPEMAVFMQKMVVFIELGIGLAILFGLFTWIASAEVPHSLLCSHYPRCSVGINSGLYRHQSH